MSKRSYHPTKRYADVTTGEVLRMLRELQEMSQVELARASGVPQTAISALENDRETLGVERAKSLGAALRVHPAVLIFPDLAPAAASPPDDGEAGELVRLAPKGRPRSAAHRRRVAS
jgi:transcriptional regulator with XRE-family HTH domain